MTRVPAARALLTAALAVLAVSAPAEAQYRPIPARAAGPDAGPFGGWYRIEFAANTWNPVPEFTVSSESLGIKGTDIDVRADLDIPQERKTELRLTLRASKRNKLRFHYLPLAYKGTTNLKADIIFNGIRYPANTSVDSSLEWKTYRVGYELDIISRTQGFLGFVVEAKYTDASFTLTSPAGTEYARARAPIPALGAIARVHITRYGSVTGEFTGFKIPESIDEDYRGHYYDWDVYGTLNFTRNFGAQIGYRSLDIGYLARQDRGDAKLSGLYFGGVVRF
ncbi:MAG TPA: hypothetical protein PLE61_14365 [Vicinamibacterales bacterium]|nr:hypothetical protein [Vicinamibacterales bacterium]HPW21985.1 hypothetical protein [Vicinamibacterales bacterium]